MRRFRVKTSGAKRAGSENATIAAEPARAAKPADSAMTANSANATGAAKMTASAANWIASLANAARCICSAGDLVAGSFRRAASPRVLWIAILAFAGALSWAQTAAEKPSVNTRRVGARLACQCGCKDSVASCSMLECSFSKPSKEKIAKMQAIGMSDRQIIDSFVQEYPGIYLAPPNLLGMLVPYAAAGLGLLAVVWFLRRYHKPAPLAELGPMELDDPALAKYKDQIEKDLANLE